MLKLITWFHNYFMGGNEGEEMTASDYTTYVIGFTFICTLLFLKINGNIQ